MDCPGPIWWHCHGKKMQIKTLDLGRKFLKLAGSAAELNIEKFADFIGDIWNVEWCILHSPIENVTGTILFTGEELRTAFGLKPVTTPSNDKHLIERFGGDRAYRGKFFGYGNHLNIPGPGTGHDGDPNISIEISDEMRDAIKQLLI